MIGFDLYIFYGMKNSVLNKDGFDKSSHKMVALSGLGMVVALVIVAIVHHSDPAIDDTFLYYFSLLFSAIHAVVYFMSYQKSR